jgi:hypothetical protein
MDATFIELPLFRANRADYLSDEEYQALQNELMANPEKGDVIKHTGGLRKARFKDPRRQKGKRSGLRVIYYYWVGGAQFWMFFVYNKDEMDDLTKDEAQKLAVMLDAELSWRTGK